MHAKLYEYIYFLHVNMFAVCTSICVPYTLIIYSYIFRFVYMQVVPAPVACTDCSGEYLCMNCTFEPVFKCVCVCERVFLCSAVACIDSPGQHTFIYCVCKCIVCDVCGCGCAFLCMRMCSTRCMCRLPWWTHLYMLCVCLFVCLHMYIFFMSIIFFLHTCIFFFTHKSTKPCICIFFHWALLVLLYVLCCMCEREGERGKVSSAQCV